MTVPTIAVTLTHAAVGGNYAGASGDLKVTVTDDDRGIVFNPTSLTRGPKGDADGETYTVKLATQPSEEVTVTVSGPGWDRPVPHRPECEYPDLHHVRLGHRPDGHGEGGRGR